MITREADYAIRCVLHLARSRQETVMVSEISRDRDIPKSFLSKILQKLARSGIVESARGVKGGFRLSRQPSEITLLEVVEAVGGPIGVNICAVDRKKCRMSGTCSVHPVWVELRKDIEDKLRGLDFGQLALKQD